ncbi:general secretion pathway protein GspB [Roseateles sp. LKC17W]|uniref:General secretion pathway protein GspB n=1 Tax=Pelomonas margarita TaxID=3299031 RepID=A0ABW7FFC2_9BURK
MSYILDALRRAEADRERERGQLPGLHTPGPAAADLAPATPRTRGWPWAAAGLLLAGLAAGAWWRGSAPPAPSPAAPPVTAATPSAQPEARPVPTLVAAPPEAPPSTPAASYLPPAPPAAPVMTPAPAPMAAAPAPLPRAAELPEATRRELPRLAISGSVYSDDPASRFVIINGEVQREGAQLGPNLVLEKIGPRELVLRFKSQRYRQPV